jgi:hypothetical protein
MSNKSDREMAEETLQRVIRTETRLMTLGAKLGFDLKDDEYIDVHPETLMVVLKSMDVAYTSVIRACRRAGLHTKKVKVFHDDGTFIAEMPV